MGKDVRDTAEKQLEKAEQLYKARQYKKAGKYFSYAADKYMKLEEYVLAKNCFLEAVSSYSEEGKNFETILEFMRNAADAALFNEDFFEAHQIFLKALDIIPSLKKASDRDFNYILFSTLSYFCLLVLGDQEKGLTVIKRAKKRVDAEYFKESPLIRLVKNLTVALRDKNKKYLEKAEEFFEEYEFSEVENKLTMISLLLVNFSLLTNTKLEIDKDKYTTHQLINLTLNIDFKHLLELLKTSFHDHTIDEIKVTKIVINLSDNLTPQEKPNLPLKLNQNQIHQLKYVLKPHFQKENPSIGPLVLTCEMDEKFVFFLETEIIKPNIVAPPTSLDISSKNLRPPLIGQTFPMEFLIENKSKGNALDINIEIELPEKVKLIRGTLKKEIYSLRSNESMKWELNLRPIDAGDFKINMNVQFKDSDQNEIKSKHAFDLIIKL